MDFDVVFGVVGGCSAVITVIGAFGKLHHQLLQNDLDKQWCCNKDNHWLLQTTCSLQACNTCIPYAYTVVHTSTPVAMPAALLGKNGEGQRWKDCMADLKKFVTHKVTKPFIQNLQVPGQDQPGLTFEVRTPTVCCSSSFFAVFVGLCFGVFMTAVILHDVGCYCCGARGVVDAHRTQVRSVVSS